MTCKNMNEGFIDSNSPPQVDLDCKIFNQCKLGSFHVPGIFNIVF